MEVAQFGIDVVLIEPGPVDTPWNQVAADSLSTAVPGADHASPNAPADDGAVAHPYAAYKAAVAASFTTIHNGPLARLSSSADGIAAVITRAVTARRPRTRYLINPVAKGVVTMNRLLPGRAYDAVVRRQYKLPG